MPKKWFLPGILALPLALSCVNQAVLQRRAAAWEEEAAVLEARGDARGAQELRDLAGRLRSKGPGGGSSSALPGRLGGQVEGLYQRAASLYKESRLDEAKLVLASALEKDPAHKPSLDLRARIESETFHPKKDKAFGDMAAELYGKGMRKLRAGDTKEAFDFLSQARQVYRDDPAIDGAYERCSAELERQSKAQEAARLYKQGRDLLDSGKPSEADLVLAQAQVLDPGLPHIEEYRKQAAEGAERLKLEALSRSLKEVRSLMDHSRYAEAEGKAAAILAANPDSTEAKALAAQVKEKRRLAGEEDKRDEDFARQISLAKEALEGGDAAAARAALTAAGRILPGAPGLDELDKKISRLEEGAGDADKRSADEAYRQGMVAYRQGRVEEAGERFREALKKDPGHEKAKKALERLGLSSTAP